MVSKAFYKYFTLCGGCVRVSIWRVSSVLTVYVEGVIVLAFRWWAAFALAFSVADVICIRVFIWQA